MLKLSRNCIKCGFLGWTTSPGRPYIYQDVLNEVTATQREGLAKGNRTRAQYLFCQKRVWVIQGNLDQERAEKVISEVNSKRRCRYCLDYRPGSTPDRHLNFEETRRNKRPLVVDIVVGIVIAVLAGLILYLTKC